MTGILKVDQIQNNTGTEAITIDANGSVTLGNPVAFEAYLSATITGLSTTDYSTVVPYNTTNYNYGDHFKTSGSDIGLFVAPFTGIYSIDGWVYSSTATFSQIWITSNGARKPYTDLVLGSSAFQGGTWNLKLTAGEKIGVHPYNGSAGVQIDTNNHHTYFRGHLVHRL